MDTTLSYANLHFSHVAQDTEDDKPCYKAGDTVDGTVNIMLRIPLDCEERYKPCQDCIFVAVVVEFVVA